MAIEITEVTTVTPDTPLIQITSSRMTYKGHQYIVDDRYSTEIVTVNNGHIGCTCGMDSYNITCQHILVVERERVKDAAQAAKRNAYCASFNIYE